MRLVYRLFLSMNALLVFSMFAPGDEGHGSACEGRIVRPRVHPSERPPPDRRQEP